MKNVIISRGFPPNISANASVEPQLPVLAGDVPGRRRWHALPGVQELHPPRPGRQELPRGRRQHRQDIRLRHVQGGRGIHRVWRHEADTDQVDGPGGS